MNDDDTPTPAHRRKETPPTPAITTYTPGTEPADADKAPATDNPSREPGSSDE